MDNIWSTQLVVPWIFLNLLKMNEQLQATTRVSGILKIRYQPPTSSKFSQELLFDISRDLPDFIHQQYLHEDLKLGKVVETYVLKGPNEHRG